MKVLVLGGDGFCGWPTSLYLSKQGHDVSIVDNLSRRGIAKGANAPSLTPIATLEDRVRTWKKQTGRDIPFQVLNVSELFCTYLQGSKPDVIIHFAKQRAAPWSMKNHGARAYTVRNNVMACHNVLNAIVETGLDTHLIHLGSTGVYGYGDYGGRIPEGYLEIGTVEGKKTEILHPQSAGSVYHMTKCMDEVMFQFYAKNYGLRITDLHQGIVWGTQTPETSLHPDLVNRYDYDGDYGTVLNRFLVQAAMGYPMTVYGTGGQTRAFIHIQDTVRCVEAALKNPPEPGNRVKILNQLAETQKVGYLAHLLEDITGTGIQHLKNPRKEAVENTLSICNTTLNHLGVVPTLLASSLLSKELNLVGKYLDRVNAETIPPTSYWTQEIQDAHKPNPTPSL